MTLTQDIAAKFAVAFVAVAMIFTAFTAPAQAQDSVEDLQALINSLMAQIAELEGDMGGDSMSSSLGRLVSLNLLEDPSRSFRRCLP